ncbi:HNH endonuclease [Sphingomonas histidinilytica]|uniref:HNH endonuclease n=1 Tax=Rhizorhabdus histidinilytica TaxID=439228 RepID=UPI001ADC6215|nr:HNH endonuclease signature motif containing protein [Rhizorhabdus histidinilytica]MBO9377883.1 HNH endonuclease [Rhizorhabdus histidinilytica]
MEWPFVIGQRYNRRKDLHERFGGSRQNGMISMPRVRALALITGEGGKLAGYMDRELPDGSWRYTGEGPSGDMQMVRQNRTLRDHVANGVDVLLFEKDGSTPFLIYRGQFVCPSWDVEDQRGADGLMRKAFVFNLVPLGHDGEDPIQIAVRDATDFAGLRVRAYAAAAPALQKTAGGPATVYQRSADVRAYVMARAAGVCEACAAPAPFETATGAPYLEAHHIDRLSDGGPDDPRRVAGICPNCHKRAHFGSDRVAFNATLRARTVDREKALG